MRRSLEEIVVRKVAAKFGASVIEVGITGGGHRYALIARAGKRRKVFFAATPGDHYRGVLNLACSVRKVVRAMAVQQGGSGYEKASA